MKLKKILPLLAVVSLTACNAFSKYYDEYLYACGTYISYTYKLVNKKPLSDTKRIILGIDEVADSYYKRETTNVYSLNKTTDKLKINKELYDLLKVTQELSEQIELFNPLVGSLAQKWKTSLSDGKVLSQDTIDAELEKINNSSLVIEQDGDNYYAQLNGQAELDLGAVTKGYLLDRVYNDVLKNSDVTDYIVDAGSSSVLLGKNADKNRSYRTVELPNYIISLRYGFCEFSLNSCVVSTSSVFEQYNEINNAYYSHIINPKTGSALALHDTVIVVSDFGSGALGDVLATTFMLQTTSEIIALESTYKVKTVVIKDDKIEYANPNLDINLNRYY